MALFAQGVIQSGEVYTPGYVSVDELPDGPRLLLAFSGEMLGHAVRTMLRIVVEELTAAGVTRAKLV